MTAAAAELIADKMHPFERSGLGKAPFAYLGMNVSTVTVGDHSRPGSTCDHCGTAITYVFSIVSSDGKVSKVGSDCICKLNRKDNADAVLITKVEAEAKKAKKNAAAARADTRVEAAAATLAARPELLTDRPHPSEWLAKKGKTLRDWAEYMLAHAGRTGELAAARVIERAAA